MFCKYSFKNTHSDFQIHNIRNYILIILYTILIILPSTTAHAEPLNDFSWPEAPSVYAEGAIVMEASTGLILYSKNIDTAYYPASTTKILTTLIALENSSLNETVTFSKNAVYDVELDSSRIGIDVGEELTMKECLYGIMLASANEVSYAVAEHVGGSIENFAKMMNEKAKSLGCTNSNFTNPHGLPDENHYTSTRDLALITRAAMQNETFRKITGTRTFKIAANNKQSEPRWIANHHRFILKQDYFYNDCIGGKTGYTSKAKYSLVSIAKRDDLELICVVMKDDSFEHQYTDTQKLLNYGFDNFSVQNVAALDQQDALKKSNFFTKYNILLSGNNSPISIDPSGYIVIPNGLQLNDISRTIIYHTGNEESPSQASKENIIGNISYDFNGLHLGGANILYHEIQSPTLTKGVREDTSPLFISSSDTQSQNEDIRPIIIAVIVAIIVFIFLLYFVFVERPRLKRRRAYLKKRKNRKFTDYNDLDL